MAAGRGGHDGLRRPVRTYREPMSAHVGMIMEQTARSKVFLVMDLNLICALLWSEKRGAINFRTGQWPKIVAMIERWQSRPSLLATPINQLAAIASLPKRTSA
jgi:hypothetical protein